MIITAEEYAELKQQYLRVLRGESVISNEAAGKTRQFQPSNLNAIKQLIDEYELINGITGSVPSRTYAKNGGDASC